MVFHYIISGVDYIAILWYNIGMNVESLRCRAMIEAGIADPEGKQGIDFCVSHCPYEDGCRLFEGKRNIRSEKKELKSVLNDQLSRHRVSVDVISLIMHCSVRTVRRYLSR